MESFQLWKLSGALLLGMGVFLFGCRNGDPEAEQVNAVIAERLDLNEEKAARVQPVTAELWGEREMLRKLRADLYDQLLAQLKSKSADSGEMEKTLKTIWLQVENLIPKAASAFSEYHAVMAPEKRAEMVEKIEKRREWIQQGRRRFWSFSDEGPTAEDINGKMAERLNLTLEQETQMLPVTEKLFDERDAIKQARLKVYDEVLAQLKNDTVDTAQLESVLHSTWTTMDVRIPMVSDAFASVHAVLTPEQRAELSEKLERRQKRRKNRRHHRWHDWH